MCMICERSLDDFSLDHMEQEIKKLRTEERLAKAAEIKKAISQKEIWLIGDRCDGWEEKAIKENLDKLKLAAYALSRYL
jgi:hypothetical protein